MIINKMKNWLIKNLGLKGSWSWAKRQMRDGKMVRCKHWNGALKYRIDNKENTLLQASYYRESVSKAWEGTTHHLNYEDFTDYEIAEWN